MDKVLNVEGFMSFKDVLKNTEINVDKTLISIKGSEKLFKLKDVMEANKFLENSEIITDIKHFEILLYSNLSMHLKVGINVVNGITDTVKGLCQYNGRNFEIIGKYTNYFIIKNMPSDKKEHVW